jgi:hypothetical protein
MTKQEVLELFSTMLAEHTPETLRAWLVELVGGALQLPVASPILAPYQSYIEAEATKVAKIRGHLGNKAPDQFQTKMFAAWDAIVAYFNKLVEVDGDITKAGEIPRQQWNGTSGFITGWGGKDARPRVIVYIDGNPTQPFLAWGISSFVPDFYAILEGCTDPSGEYWKPYNIVKRGDVEQTFPCWNKLEMTDSYKPTTTDDDLALIRNFDLKKGQLRNSPIFWPEPFKKAWFEGHPDYVFPGVLKREAWVKPLGSTADDV